MHEQQKQKEASYKRICDKVEALSFDINQNDKITGFENFLSTLIEIRREYIANFHEMTNYQKQNSSLLLNAVKDQIHESLDVYRARSMYKSIN